MKKIISSVFEVIMIVIIFLIIKHSPILNSFPLINVESDSIIFYCGNNEYIFIS